MALPTIKYPTFALEIPSTKELVKFRPFTVAEEKILLMASESGNFEDVSNAITDVLTACFLGNVSVKDLPSFDIEYMFLHVRAKSVSDIIELQYRNPACPKEDGERCKKVVKLNIKIEDVKVQQANKEGKFEIFNPKAASKSGTKIMLTDDLGVMVSYPNVANITKANTFESPIDQIEDLISSCINSVFDEENVYTDFSKKEFKDWYSGLLSGQKDSLIEFVKNMPQLRYEMNYKCNTCGYEERMVFEGLQSFL
jgi:hypothetical protein